MTDQDPLPLANGLVWSQGAYHEQGIVAYGVHDDWNWDSYFAEFDLSTGAAIFLRSLYQTWPEWTQADQMRLTLVSRGYKNLRVKRA